MSEWISVDNKPDEWCGVLLYFPNDDDGSGDRGVTMGWFSPGDGPLNGFSWRGEDLFDGRPTYWMPLPKPPQDG